MTSLFTGLAGGALFASMPPRSGAPFVTRHPSPMAPAEIDDSHVLQRHQYAYRHQRAADHMTGAIARLKNLQCAECDKDRRPELEYVARIEKMHIVEQGQRADDNDENAEIK